MVRMGLGRVIIAALVLHTYHVLAQQKCGLVPSKVYLAKGEKRQLVFWTDQDYSQAITVTSQPTSTTGASTTSTEPEVDTFLQAVNGQLPGFGSNKDDQGPFQFVNDNQTSGNDATIVNAELPELSIEHSDDNSGISFEDEISNTVEIDSLELTDEYEQVTESGQEIKDSENFVNSNTSVDPFSNEEEFTTAHIPETSVDVTENADENHLESSGDNENIDILVTDDMIDDDETTISNAPVTAANVAEIEENVWVDLPENLNSVDKWPELPVASVLVEGEETTILFEDEETTISNAPVTAANVAEIENNVWVDLPEKSDTVDKWPELPVAPVLVEDEETTISNEPITAANVAEIEDNVWVDLPENSNGVDKWPEPPVAPVLAEDIETTTTVQSIDEETTTLSEDTTKYDEETEQETSTGLLDVSRGETTVSFKEFKEEMTTESNKSDLEKITTVSQYNMTDKQDITTEYEHFDNITGQENNEDKNSAEPFTSVNVADNEENVLVDIPDSSDTTEVPIAPVLVEDEETTTEPGQFDSETTTEFKELDANLGQEETMNSSQNLHNDEKEITTEYIAHYDNESVTEVGTEKSSTMAVPKIAEIKQTSQAASIKKDHEIPTTTMEYPEPETKVTFEDEMLETVEPFNLDNNTDLFEDSSSDTSSTDDKITFIENENANSIADYTISDDISDDDPDSEDYLNYDLETSTTQTHIISKTNEDSESNKDEIFKTSIVTDTPEKINDFDTTIKPSLDNDDMEDNIQVVTSMTLKESEQILQDLNTDNDKISVVTSISVEEPIKNWDELELFEEVDQTDKNNKPIKVAEKLYDEDANINDILITSESSKEESTTVNIHNEKPIAEEETTLRPVSTNTKEDKLKTKATADEPTSDTINISTQDDKNSNVETSILFGLDFPNEVNLSEQAGEATTYFPISDNEIQDDDTEYSYYDDNFDISPLQEVDSVKVFSFTTTGSPNTVKEASDSVDSAVPSIEAVVADIEDSQEIFDETTTGSSLQITNIEEDELNKDDDEGDDFEIEAVESETDIDDIITEFDETTTGTPLFIPSIEAVIAEVKEEGSGDVHVDQKKEFDETTIDNFKIEAIFADTTTGSSLENNKLLKKESIDVSNKETTTLKGSDEDRDEENDKKYEDNGIYDDDVEKEYEFKDNNEEEDESTTKVGSFDQRLTETTTDELITSTQEYTTDITPAYTTASSRKNSTVTSADIDQPDSSKIIFPSEDDDTVAIFNFKENVEVLQETTEFPKIKDNVVKLIEDVLAQEVILDEVQNEDTTVRVVIDSNIMEVTRRNIISMSGLNESSENQPITSTESEIMSKQNGQTESEIIQVETGNVNGPLSLDEVIYYDDADGNEDDEYEALSDEKVAAGSVIATDEFTTEVNGFIVNKKNIVKTLDNNNIETVRTSGDKESVNIDIGKDNTTVDSRAEPTTEENEDIEDLETSTTTANEMDIRNMQFNEETTTAESFTEIPEKYEDLSTKNPNIEIDVVKNVLELENEEFVREENLLNEVNVKNVTAVEQNNTNTEKEKKPAAFPVTELLNGIYKLIQGYIPTRAEVDPSIENLESDTKVDDLKSPNNIEYFESPNAEPLYNVHNAPRDTTPFTTPKTLSDFEDSVDFANSNTDPFQQLSAPDLTGLIPETEREENIQYIFASQVKKSPAITLSPFNSDALKVQEPPKVLFDKLQEKVDTDEEKEESSFSSLTKVIQQPFKSFLPSFLTSPKIKTTSDKVQVAGSLPVTVRDPSNPQRIQVGRRPIQKLPARGQPDSNKSRFPLLGSLFSSLSTNSPKKQPIKPRRPLRPDVPAQQPVQKGFVPIPTRQRSSPVSIPLPGSVEEEQQPSQSQFSPKIGRLAREEPAFEIGDDIEKKLLRYIEERPLPMRNALLKPRSLEQEQDRRRREAEQPVNCTWTIQTEKNLYLLVTFHNLSAPFTVDCEGAYIEVERENNGFEARWCGNRVTQGGSRPHVIFARNEVRITVFDDGLEGKNLPTGFNADVEVIDLFDAGEFSSLRKTKGYSSVQRSGRSIN